MTRVVNVREHALKRNEIVTAARRLVQTKGYEQMAIQDVLDDLQISKGAFYHYFGSKQALLEAIIERMLAEVENLFLPILQDPQLPALEKLRRYFSLIVRWRTEQKDLVLELARVWLADENAIVRQKLHAIGIKRTAPLLATIIRQGNLERVFTTAYPDQVGAIILSLMEGLNEALLNLFLSSEADRVSLRAMEDVVGAYTTTIERMLGTSEGSLQIVDATTLKEWVVPLRNNAGRQRAPQRPTAAKRPSVDSPAS